MRQEVAGLKKRLAEFEGQPHLRDEAPTDAEVLQALKKEGIVGLAEVTIVKNKLLDQLGPVQLYPTVGMAQLRSVHWKCTAYYLELDAKGVKSADAKNKALRVQLVYIDKGTLVPAGDRK